MGDLLQCVAMPRPGLRQQGRSDRLYSVQQSARLLNRGTLLQKATQAERERHLVRFHRRDRQTSVVHAGEAADHAGESNRDEAVSGAGRTVHDDQAVLVRVTERG